jgi:hypothetical protein
VTAIGDFGKHLVQLSSVRLFRESSRIFAAKAPYPVYFDRCAREAVLGSRWVKATGSIQAPDSGTRPAPIFAAKRRPASAQRTEPRRNARAHAPIFAAKAGMASANGNPSAPAAPAWVAAPSSAAAEDAPCPCHRGPGGEWARSQGSRTVNSATTKRSSRTWA